jgi:hypothetical protein
MTRVAAVQHPGRVTRHGTAPPWLKAEGDDGLREQSV